MQATIRTNLHSYARPASGYFAAVQRATALQGQNSREINNVCRTDLLTHNKTTDRAETAVEHNDVFVDDSCFELLARVTDSGVCKGTGAPAINATPVATPTPFINPTAKILGGIKRGEVLLVVGRSADGKWFEVLYKGVGGWVFAALVKPITHYASRFTLLVLWIGFAAATAACTRTGESGNVAAIPTTNNQPSTSNSQQPITDTTRNTDNPLSLQELDKPPERPLYVLNVNLDYDTGVITAQQRIEFVNPTGVPIDEIKFSVPPARRANALTFRDARIYRAKQPLHFELNGPVLTVKLPATLQPGKAIAITFDFSVAVPLQEIVGAIGGDDTSRGSNNLTAGHWYLVLPPYIEGAWDLPEYAPVGDPFSSELADFEVNILAPEGVTIAAGGDEVREGRLWKYSLPKARVFAFAASPFYDMQSMTENGVTYLHYGFPRYKDMSDDVMFTAQRAVELFSRLYGPYPYKTLRIVQTDRAQGQEYSGMIAIGAVLYRGYTGKGSRHDVIATTVHETSHQWWFNVVGNDQVRTPWLDETFARFCELKFYQTYYPKDVDWWYSNYIAGKRKASGKIDKSIYDYADSAQYVEAVYRNGVEFLRTLRDQVGKDVFDDILKDYYTAEAYKITTPASFFDAVARHSDEDVRGVVKAFFANTVVLPCKISANEPGCRQ